MAWCDSLNSLIQMQIVHGVGLGLCKAAFGGEVGEGGVAGGWGGWALGGPRGFLGGLRMSCKCQYIPNRQL
jgi:hypothetical protein